MRVVVLGSTGSIGTSSLDVIRELDGVELFGIAANRSVEKFSSQLEEFKPPEAVIADSEVYSSVKDTFSRYQSTNIRSGSSAIIDLVTDSRVDVVINGLSGIAGLYPTIEALKAGKTVASANKESIVMGWHLIKDSITAEDQLIPVDSEHSAVLQGREQTGWLL